MDLADFLTFADIRACLIGAPADSVGLVRAYHSRVSYIENHFTGIILVPNRRVASELQSPSFSCYPDEYRRRIVRRTMHHFLGRRFRAFGELSFSGHCYLSPDNAKKAERCKGHQEWEQEEEITVDAALLSSYCRNERLTPIFVTDSYRFSERAINEAGITDDSQVIRGATYCYALQTGTKPDPSNRPKMAHLGKTAAVR